MRHLFARSALALLLLSTTLLAHAACITPTRPVQARASGVTQWGASASMPVNIPAYIQVDVNVSLDRLKLFAVNGSFSQPVPLNQKRIATWTVSMPSTWRFEAYCDGQRLGSANVTHTAQIDVLSYVRPGGIHGLPSAVMTNKENPWRTFSYNNGDLNERLPGFFITKGNVDWPTGKAWNFEQMMYDSAWIYLVRDTSWTSHCIADGAPVGMLLFVDGPSGPLRGGRHFPRHIANGATVNTGQKRIQGVKKKTGPAHQLTDEGAWCEAEHAGWTSSDVRADVYATATIGGKALENVLKLSIVGGSGNQDAWWFAQGIGLVQFRDANQQEYLNRIENLLEIGVRIPCEPLAPCM